jgi:hypothetical protein
MSRLLYTVTALLLLLCSVDGVRNKFFHNVVDTTEYVTIFKSVISHVEMTPDAYVMNFFVDDGVDAGVSIAKKVDFLQRNGMVLDHHIEVKLLYDRSFVNVELPASGDVVSFSMRAQYWTLAVLRSEETRAFIFDKLMETGGAVEATIIITFPFGFIE